MATMEDRLLGEKLHYYCSSSEEEEEEDEEEGGEEEGFDVEKSKQSQADKIQDRAYLNGPRQNNTGVKGVREDARAYRRFILEKEQGKLDELAKAAARFVLEDPTKSEDEWDLEEDDEFMAAYRAKRILELKEKAAPVFGVVRELTGFTYPEVIDGTPPTTHVIVYIYEDHMAACRRYKEYLARLASEFPQCLVCHIRASKAEMSATFIRRGLPCFIAYRAGEVVTTWLNICEYIGSEAEYDVLVEGMQEVGVLPYY